MLLIAVLFVLSRVAVLYGIYKSTYKTALIVEFAQREWPPKRPETLKKCLCLCIPVSIYNCYNLSFPVPIIVAFNIIVWLSSAPECCENNGHS